MTTSERSIEGLSFDISRKSTGVAYWVNREPWGVLTVELPLADLGEQLDLWEKQLADILKAEPEWIAFEDARAVNKQHGKILFGMTGILAMHAYRLQVPLFGYSQTHIKKIMTGNGKATKEDMMNSCRERFPELAITTDDHADAVAAGLAFWNGQDNA